MPNDLFRELLRDPSDQPGPRPWRFLFLYAVALALLAGVLVEFWWV
jgi:hypothetical protein